MNQLMRFEDLREWLLSQIDGSEETRGDDSLISHFIRQIDALPSEKGAIGLEPKGCPTPGACSAVEEIADLKQRLLPQFQGRAQRAEHERDALLEQLIAARSATAATDLDEFVRVARTFSDEHYQNALVAELRRVYHAHEETAQGHARYEYIRTLNPRQFAALYDEALADERFDDLVDRYRMKQRPHDAGEPRG